MTQGLLFFMINLYLIFLTFTTHLLISTYFAMLISLCFEVFLLAPSFYHKYGQHLAYLTHVFSFYIILLLSKAIKFYSYYL